MDQEPRRCIPDRASGGRWVWNMHYNREHDIMSAKAEPLRDDDARTGPLRTGRRITARRRFRMITTGGLLCTVLLSSTVLHAAEPVPPMELERLVSRWVELRQAAADEQRAWEDERAQLGHLRQVLELEKAALSEDIAALRQAQEAATVQQARTGAALDAMQPQLERWDALLAEADAHAGSMFLQLPAVLTVPHADVLTPVAADAGRLQRLQQVLYRYALVESLQHEIHSVNEVLEFDEGRWAMDVLYLGTARAFAVNADGSFAAEGMPEDGGWRWTARPQIAPDVRAALRIHRRAEPARLVRLPLAGATTEAP